nr:DOPA 4,5-dioxygenase family protein [Bradyrhizobium sp. dw_411]
MSETTAMTIPRPIAEISSYHAHIYYDPATTRPTAEQLRTWIGERFPVQLGRWHDVRVGPHDGAMFQVAFAKEHFATLVPWLMLNHGGLSILVHPNTVNPRRDHADDPFWIGTSLPIHDEKLPSESELEGAPQPNTAPHLTP